MSPLLNPVTGSEFIQTLALARFQAFQLNSMEPVGGSEDSPPDILMVSESRPVIINGSIERLCDVMDSAAG